MKPTLTEEVIPCIVQLNADIEELTDIMEYIKPIHERLHTLTEELQKRRETA